MKLDDLIRQTLDESEVYTHAGIAQRLCDEHPDVVEEYLQASRTVIVSEVVAGIARSRRSAAAAARARSVFAEATEAGADAVREWVRGFGAAAFAVDDANTQKRVARMTRGDCLYVANKYADAAKTNGLMAAVFRAVAERVPEGMEVSDVFTEDDLDDLRSRVLGTAA